MNIFTTAFITVFLAELGDKTQIATLLFAANKEHSKVMVFFGAALALVLTTLIAVLVGSALSHYLNEKTLKLVGGIGFILVGTWTLFAK
ncbi:TMEM165/GDT1 family protein [Candidatus Gracilibacteria bacterium]|nr:TMEM165/GDT1 family protein [Candidatus Gracilibacteria bacterium]